MAEILDNTPDSLRRCAQFLARDEIVAVPTETVYGLAGNALSETAVRRIFDVKGRPLIDPLICHFPDADSAFQHVDGNTEAEKLAAAFWPGPLTLVLPKRDTIPDLVTAGLPSAAVRVPAQPDICALLERLDFPLAAPSANPFGYVSPTRPVHVQQTLGDRIPAILDGGPCHHGLESTILDLREPSHPRLLRPGPVSCDTLAGILQCDIDLGAPKSSSATAARAAPGLLSQHYSPRARVRLLPHGFQDFQTLDELGAEKAALLLNTRPQSDLALEADLYWMAESEDLAEIGQNLFAMLQKCDRMGYGILFTEEAVDKGLGQAINDRLRRAAAG